MIAQRIGRAPVGTLFETTEFASLGLVAAETALSRMQNRGDILRVRRGLYWKPPRSRFGTGAPSPLAVALKLCDEKGVGPTGWNAASALGLTTQVPATLELVVVGPPPTGIERVRFGSRSNLRRIGLGYLEVALLEILRGGWVAFCDTDTLRGRVETLVREKRIRWPRLMKAAEREPSRVVSRLRAIAPARDA